MSEKWGPLQGVKVVSCSTAQAGTVPYMASELDRINVGVGKQGKTRQRFSLGGRGGAWESMVVVNQAGVIVLVNVQAEKQFGYRRDELLGQRVTNIIPEGFAERLVTDASRSKADALAQEIGTGLELLGRRKDGETFPIEIMCSERCDKALTA